MLDAAGNEIAGAQERSLFVALFRRLVGLVPFIGDFADWLPIAYHFDYYMGEERIGGLERILGVRDRYRSTCQATPTEGSIAASCWRSPSAWTRCRHGSGRQLSGSRLPPAHLWLLG